MRSNIDLYQTDTVSRRSSIDGLASDTAVRQADQLKQLPTGVIRAKLLPSGVLRQKQVDSYGA